MGRKITKATPPPTVLEQVERAALQAIDERDELAAGLDSLKIERAAAIQRYDDAIIETGKRLNRSTVLAEQLQALYNREDVR